MRDAAPYLACWCVVSSFALLIHGAFRLSWGVLAVGLGLFAYREFIDWRRRARP